MNQPLHHQPDDPGIRCCPRCGYREPHSEEEVARRLLKANAGKVHKVVIARALDVSVERVEAIAKKFGFDLTLQKEPEPRGA
jgi:hypothetical protein